MKRLNGVFVMHLNCVETVYGPDEMAAITKLIDIAGPAQTAESIWQHPEILAACDVLLTGWGAPKLDAKFLAAAPRLKLVLYGAGTVRYTVTQEMWDRGIHITSAYAANALPVAEYALGLLLVSLKHTWNLAQKTRRLGTFATRTPVPGNYRSTIGLVSMGMIAKLLREKLRPFDHRIIVYDPFLSKEAAQKLNVELVSLDELFRTADAISLHTPDLPETNGMISAPLLASMKPGATLINTARGAVIDEPKLIEVAAQRPDLQFILDVTHPEPPVAGSPLYTLPNVVLTPHIAGSLDTECRRMGATMADELRRYLEGKPLQWEITPEIARTSSHRPDFMKAN